MVAKRMPLSASTRYLIIKFYSTFLLFLCLGRDVPTGSSFKVVSHSSEKFTVRMSPDDSMVAVIAKEASDFTRLMVMINGKASCEFFRMS